MYTYRTSYDMKYNTVDYIILKDGVYFGRMSSKETAIKFCEVLNACQTTV